MFNSISAPLLMSSVALLSPLVLLAVCLIPASVARSHGRAVAKWTAKLAGVSLLLISRLAETCMLLAVVLVWRRFDTLEFDQLFAKASALAGTASPRVGWIALLLVIAALLKSAQFPFHSWLPETLETPTPVSALMHAGIINAGGFLIVRLSPLSRSRPLP